MKFSISLRNSFTSVVFVFLLLQTTLGQLAQTSQYESRSLNGNACSQNHILDWQSTLQFTISYCSPDQVLKVLRPFDVVNGNDYIIKKYTNLPSHTVVYFAFTLYEFVSQPNLNFYSNLDIQFDSIVPPINMEILPGLRQLSHCNGHSEYLISTRIYGSYFHNSNKLKFGVKHEFNNQFVNAFALHDVVLYFATDVSLTPFNKATQYTPFMFPKAACSSGNFLSSSAFCKSCHPSCKECFGPTSSECYECAPGYGFDAASNGCVKCDASCGTCYGSAQNQCTSCIGSDTLFIDNTCVSSCPLPLAPITYSCVDYCTLPCSLPSYIFPLFVYDDNTCSQVCEAPQTSQLVMWNIYKCDFPCGSNHFLMWDGTCSATCPYNQRSENSRKYCNPSCTHQFIAPNGSCVATCGAPQQQIPMGSETLCQPPCSNPYLFYNEPSGQCSSQCTGIPSVSSQGYLVCTTSTLPTNLCPNKYIAQNGSCINSCAPPMNQVSSGSGTLCKPPCSPHIFYNVSSGQCSSQCEGISSVSSYGYLVCTASSHTSTPDPNSSEVQQTPTSEGFFDSLLLAPSEPGTVTFVTFVKFQQYVRMLKVKLPPRLDRMSVSEGRPVLSLHVQPHIARTIHSWFNQERYLAEVQLHKQSVQARFLANFGGDIFVIMIIIASGLLFTLLKLLAVQTKNTTLEAIFGKLQTITRWNLPLMLFGLYIDDIILFSSVEFQTIKFDSPSSKLSFAMCLLIDMVAIAFLVSTFLLARKSGMLRKEAEQTKNDKNYNAFLNNWRSFQLYFRGFNDRPLLNQLFFFVYISRAAFPMLLATALESAPVVQAVFQMIISLIIVIYALVMKPLRKRVNQYQLVIVESIVLLLNICVLALVAQDNQGINDTPGCVFLGDVIIMGNILANLVIIVILAIKVGMMLKDIRDVYKKSPLQAAICCIHLVVPPLQQGALGFEELLEDIKPSTSHTLQKQITKEGVVISQGQTLESHPSMKQSRIVPEVTLLKTNTQQRHTSQRTAGDEILDQPSTERLGQSTSRLLIGSQLFNQSQVNLGAHNISFNNDISMESPSPKYKKKLNEYFKSSTGSHTQNQTQTTANNTYKGSVSRYEEYGANKSSVIVERGQMGGSPGRSQFNTPDAHLRKSEALVLGRVHQNVKDTL